MFPAHLLPRLAHLFAIICFGIGNLLLATSLCAAEAVPTSKLLPEETLLLVRVPSGKELASRLEQTAIGRMVSDPRLQPLIERLWGSASDALQPVEQRLGMPPLEAIRMFEGDLTFALIDLEGRMPAPVLLIEIPAESAQLDKVVAQMEAALVENGGEKSDEEMLGHSVTAVRSPRGNRHVLWCKAGGRLLVCEGRPAMELLLQRLQPSATSLSDNPRYATIMNRCRQGEAAEPQALLFADPINLAKGFAGGNLQMQLALSMLPALGFDGLQGIGGTLTLATENFDQIVHAHVLLDHPRQGALKAVALRSGNAEPPSWVPANAASYTTFRWDLSATFEAVTTLFDSFQGAGSFKDLLRRRVSERLNVDFEQEILPALTGRVTMIAVMEQPARSDSRGGIWGLELHDAEAFKATLEELAANERLQLSPREYRGVTYFEGSSRRRRGELDPAENAPRPCLALVENTLVMTDRTSLLQSAIAAQQGAGSLAAALDYKLVASRLSRQPGGDRPVFLSFSRPEEDLRHWLELANSEEFKQTLARRAERSELARTLHEIVAAGQLPPVAVLKEYLAPGGAIITDDESGFHFMSIFLKRK